MVPWERWAGLAPSPGHVSRNATIDNSQKERRDDTGMRTMATRLDQGEW